MTTAMGNKPPMNGAATSKGRAHSRCLLAAVVLAVLASAGVGGLLGQRIGLAPGEIFVVSVAVFLSLLTVVRLLVCREPKGPESVERESEEPVEPAARSNAAGEAAVQSNVLGARAHQRGGAALAMGEILEDTSPVSEKTEANSERPEESPIGDGGNDAAGGGEEAMSKEDGAPRKKLADVELPEAEPLPTILPEDPAVGDDEPDDLTLISGVDEDIAIELYALGITRFEHFAQLGPMRIKRLAALLPGDITASEVRSWKKAAVDMARSFGRLEQPKKETAQEGAGQVEGSQEAISSSHDQENPASGAGENDRESSG